MSKHMMLLALLAIAGTGWTVAAIAQPDPPAPAPSITPPNPPSIPPSIALAEQMELARLVDVTAQRLRLNIEYDPATLKGTATLRLGAAAEISDAQLWDLTNRLLAARGFTTVQVAGRDDVYSVVKLESAAALARVVDAEVFDLLMLGESGAMAPGFTGVVYTLKHRTGKQAEEILKPLLSKPGGSVALLGPDLILIADLTPRVRQTLELLGRIDVQGQPAEVLVVPIANLTAIQLSAMVTQVSAKRDLVEGAATTTSAAGEVLPGPDGRSVLVVAPASAQKFWLDLIASLDKREPFETRSYVPRYFDLKEVQRLIEDTLQAAAAPASVEGTGGGGPRIVIDDLTGTLSVTASLLQHEQIAAIVERLNSVPREGGGGGRRPMLIFKVRNRSVADVLGVLESLIASGELVGELPFEPGSGSDGEAASAGQPSSSAPAAPQATAQSPLFSNPSRSTADAIVQRNQARRGQGVAGAGEGAGRSPGTTGRGNGEDLVLTADEGISSIIAVGPPRLLSQIERLIKQLDVRQPQVMVQALVVSLSDSQTRDLGVELEGQINLSGDSVLRLASLFGLSTAGAQVGERLSGGTGGTGLLLSPGEFAVVIRALETISHGRSISVPQVLVNNNQQASFNSTIEQPYATIISTTDTQARSSFGGSTSAGTVVSAKPQIGQGDFLILDYTVELSAFVGEAAPGSNLPPPKQTNNVASSVTLPDGYTVAVGGLELATQGNSVDQVPLLSAIPLIGEAFKNRSRSSSRTRLFVFLRAEVMRHERFEDLKYLSHTQTEAAEIDDGWPELEPRIIR